MSFLNIILIFILAIYLFFLGRLYVKKSKQRVAIENIDKNDFPLFFWEEMIMKNIELPKEKLKIFFYIERVSLVLIFGILSYKLGAIALFLAFIVVVIFVGKNAQAKTIEKAGIDYIVEINAFLDSYIPSISSGLSNDQAMLKFINSSEDEDLFAWWVSKDEITTIIPNKWKRIIEIYNMMKYNEDRGISNSLPIIEEMQEDLNEKQKYYESYKARVGEIQPIVISYYFGVPFFLLFSYYNVQDFWKGLYGYIAVLVLCIMFASFEFIIYKIRRSTIESIF